MKMPNRESVAELRREYPKGTRVELIRMEDVQAPPAGTQGTVRGVDATGSLLVRWDNGSSLNVIYGEDAVRKVDTVRTICYGEERVWPSRKEAMDFFWQGVCATEGSEQNRYLTIYQKLNEGWAVCSDD